MEVQETSLKILPVLEQNMAPANYRWLRDKIDTLIAEPSARQLYLTYSLVGSKIPAAPTDFSGLEGSEALAYIQEHRPDLTALSRIYLLTRVLEADASFYAPKVSKLIELADTSELTTFLRYLVLLPQAQAFKNAAVEALRTNIAQVFDAIALRNPYPGMFFNDQQWNQMYLKAAFMQRPLDQIRDVDARGNKDLARIISDYAHERWAASRPVDPYFWRPVSAFLDDVLMEDMKRLLHSEEIAENRAAALVLSASENPQAVKLLQQYPELESAVKEKELRWDTLKE